MKCESCAHKEVCTLKEKYMQKALELAAAHAPFEVELKCKHFLPVTTDPLRLINKHLEKQRELEIQREYERHAPPWHITSAQ